MTTTGVPGGAVGVDLAGRGFTSDVVMGDLYGNLWRLDAATGTNTTSPSTKPLFSFSTDRHPIGALPAILDNGSKVAVFGSGSYADPSGAALWTTTSQRLIGVKLSGTTTLDESSGSLAINKALLNANEKISSQVLVVGTEIFITTDNSDINSTSYGNLGASTGAAYNINIAAQTPAITLVNVLQGGASGLAFNSSTTKLIGGAADKTQELASLATTTGTSVDYSNTPKATRLVWLKATL